MANLNKEALLNDILERDLIRTFFQPIFNTNKKEILGFEALSRGPANTPLEYPETLFDAAEQFGKLSELDLACRKAAIKNFCHLQLEGKLFLNVSPNILLTPGHPKGETLNLLQQYKLKANRVVIEVTEQDPVEDSELLKQTLNYYRHLGFTIAIDDLGSGYSGLKQWSELRPDIVKIDRYFIQDCHKCVVKNEFLRFIVQLAKATNARVIAEGIEHPKELETLKLLGVKLTQGYLLARPSERPIKQFNDFEFGHSYKGIPDISNIRQPTELQPAV